MSPDVEEEESKLIEEEDVGPSSKLVKPWDPGKIRITTKAFSLRDVVDQISDADIDLAPDFQRDFVWKERQKTRLIESILLGIPLPAFYFNQRDDGTYQVIDGVQRLTTVSLFMQNHHTLNRSDLEYLHALHGTSYATLEPAAQRRLRATQIVVHVIEPQTPEEMKYDIFSRVNTLGSPLSAQEIRHATSRERSRLFLRRLSESDAFDAATEWQFWRASPERGGDSIRDSARMTNRELVLRFCAFYDYSEERYRVYPSLDSFLVAYTRRLDGTSDTEPHISDKGLADLEQSFIRAMENAAEILGPAAFRRWPVNQRRRGPINRAVFESQAIALSRYSLKQLRKKQSDIALAFRSMFSNADYSRAVTVGTGDPISVTRRLDVTKKLLAEIV